MKSILKVLVLLSLLFSIAAYESGCSSAEQTTGKLAFQQGDFQKAETEFLKETKQNPANEEAWVYLAMTELQLNKIPEAEAAMKKYREIGKNTYQNEIIDLWGKKYDDGYKNYISATQTKDNAQAQKLYNLALKDFEGAVILEPDSVLVNKNIGIIYSKLNMPEEAVRYYAKVLDKVNDESTAIQYAKLLNDLGADKLKDNKFQEAVDDFKKADDLKIPDTNPVYEVTVYNTGLAYLKWGEDVRVKGQEANPNDTTYKSYYRKALPFLEELSKSNDKDNKLAAYELLVQVYGNLNMTEQALEAIKIRDELKNNK
jgi:tetratricopeptide (TPR) repeat protein